MRKTILGMIVLTVLALFIVGCQPGGKGIGGIYTEPGTECKDASQCLYGQRCENGYCKGPVLVEPSYAPIRSEPAKDKYGQSLSPSPDPEITRSVMVQDGTGAKFTSSGKAIGGIDPALASPQPAMEMDPIAEAESKLAQAMEYLRQAQEALMRAKLERQQSGGWAYPTRNFGPEPTTEYYPGYQK